ncbi:hypothetical protein AVEN_58398-1 [Araneus ventricosus]|uniref:Uncharacterized protein n=1 Tax=Araneus ventricosus TaxID=182803 RepID=A0A4Y2F2S8_ARAVE|nr:hypothetical protein AVEN_58398-1 [Araneus ventricosus]
MFWEISHVHPTGSIAVMPSGTEEWDGVLYINHVNSLIPRRLFLLAPLKTKVLEENDVNWTLPTWVVIFPTASPPDISFPQGARKWAVVGKDNWTPLPRSTPKQSQNLTSPQKKAIASDRPPSLLRGNF